MKIVQITAGGCDNKVIYGLGDDGKTYYWDNKKHGRWIRYSECTEDSDD